MTTQAFDNTFKGQTDPRQLSEREGVFLVPSAADHPDLAGLDEPATAADLLDLLLDPTKSPEEVATIQQEMTGVVADSIREAGKQSGKSFPGAGWTVEEFTVAGSAFEENAPEVEIRVTAPPGEATAPRPLLFSIHGGGLFLGDAEMDSAMLFDLIENDDIGERPVVVQPNYRLAPIHKYPAAIEDCFAALAWALDNTDTLGVDPERVVLFGASSGGTLAASLSFLARDRGLAGVSAQMLQWAPLSDLAFSRSDRLDLPTWNAAHSRASWQAYLGDYYGRADLPPYAAPMRGIDYRGLPPTIIHVAELDRDRDDVMRFSQNLLDANVYTELHLWGGTFHGFPFVTGGVDVCDRFSYDATLSLKSALSGKLPRREGQEYR